MALSAAKDRAEDLQQGIASNRLDDAVNGRACVSAASTKLLPANRLPSSLSDLAQRAGLGRIGALIRPFFVAGWDAVGQFPRD
jgi:hypothetical protein